MTSVPEQWSRESLGRILSAIEAGRNFRCIEKPPEDGNPGVVKVSAVTWGTFDELESKTCPDPRLLNERYLIRPGDLLISRANTLELVGACVMVGSISRRLMLSDKILRLVMPEELKRWVLWFLRSKAGRAQIEAKASGNQLSMRNIGQEGIRSIELPVAPPMEREQIVAAIESHFSRLDAATATLERVQRNLERYRASVLKAAVEGRLVPTEAEQAKKEGRSLRTRLRPAEAHPRRAPPPLGGSRTRQADRQGQEADRRQVEGEIRGTRRAGHGWLPELPEGWCWATADMLASSIRNGCSTAPREKDGVRILRISAVRSLACDVENVRFLPLPHDDYEDYFVQPGDLLFTRYNGTPSLVGVCAVVRHLPAPTVHPDKLIRVQLLPGLEVGFVEIAANVGASRKHVESRIRTTAGQAGVSGADIKSLPIPLPPLAEQAHIRRVADELLTVAVATAVSVAASSARAVRLRQSILKWAFEGRLVEADAP
jgi:type I restriction enzyme S subunit